MPKVTSTKPKKPSQSKKRSLLSQVVESKKKTSEKTAPAEEEDSAASASDAEEADGNGDHLHGFSTDEDSSDEEAVDEAEPDALEISKLPTFAKDDASVKRKLDQAKRTPAAYRGVIAISRLPHGFYEDQLKAYFTQFGTITRLRLSRNKKTGKSKHYGFIEFDSAAVAQIVSETMDNYLLMGHILRCKVVPREDIHPELWIGSNKKWRVVPRDRIARTEHNAPRTQEEQNKATKRLLKRQNERKRKLEESGIQYNFDKIAYVRTS